MVNHSVKLVALREMSVLDSLTQAQLETLAAQSSMHKAQKNRILYEIGSPMEYVYLVTKGSIKLGIFSTCGKCLTKDIAYNGDIFGENIFTESLITKEFAESMTDCVYYKIPVSTFKALVIENHNFASVVMNIIIVKLQSLEERLQNFVFRKAKERIVDFIYRSGLKRGIKIGAQEYLIDHGMSHREIAYLTDTSRQTVARILNELKKENMIHYGTRKSSKILIRDLTCLQNYSLVS